jgi:small subunit ribosomal protein S6e
MKQGVFTSGRVRLLLKEGSSCYRPRRSGERKRKSVRGCIVSSDIRALSLVLVKKGDAEIPGLTDVTKPRRLGPKRVTRIRKLYGLEKGENVEALVKKHAIRRTFQSKKTPAAHQRTKAPKIQRLVTDARLRRKKVIKKEKVDRWKKTLAAVAEYKKLYSEWAEKKRKEHHAKEKEAAEKLAEEKGGKKDVKKDVKKDAKKDDKAKKDVKADPKAVKTAKPATTKPAATTTTTTQKVETKTSTTTKPAPVKKADSKPAETKKTYFIL